MRVKPGWVAVVEEPRLVSGTADVQETAVSERQTFSVTDAGDEPQCYS